MDISLLSTIDENYRVPFETLAFSLLSAKQATTAVEWHVFVPDSGGWDAWLAGMNARHRAHGVTFLVQAARSRVTETLPIRGRTNPIVYVRLSAPEQAPLGTARVLFLDADMLAVGPIEELWGSDLASRPCACSQDLAIPTVSSGMAIADSEWWQGEPDRPYFNAGLMLIDVATWKEQEVARRALAYLAKRADAVNMFEQEALNAVLGKNWQRLSYRWNLIASVAGRPFLDTTWLDREDYAHSLRAPGFIHYAGLLKPWLNPYLAGRWHALYRDTLYRAVPAHRYRFALKHLVHAGYDAWLRRGLYRLEQRVWCARRGF